MICKISLLNQEALTANSQPVWFPYLALDQLLTALQKLDDDDHLSAVNVFAFIDTGFFLFLSVTAVLFVSVDVSWTSKSSRLLS